MESMWGEAGLHDGLDQNSQQCLAFLAEKTSSHVMLHPNRMLSVLSHTLYTPEVLPLFSNLYTSHMHLLKKSSPQYPFISRILAANTLYIYGNIFALYWSGFVCLPTFSIWLSHGASGPF